METKSDGSVSLDVSLNVGQAYKDLEKIQSKVNKISADLNKKESQKSTIESDLAAAGEQADTAKHKIESMKDSLREAFKARAEQIQSRVAAEEERLENTRDKQTQKDIQRFIKLEQDRVAAIEKMQSQLEMRDFKFSQSMKERAQDLIGGDTYETVTALQQQQAILSKSEKTTEKLKKDHETITQEIKAQTAELRSQRSEEVKAQTKLAKAQSIAPVNDAIKGATDTFNKFTRTITNSLRRVFFFSLFYMGFRQIRDGMMDMIKTNEDAVAAIARLKGAFLTMVQPIMEVVIPAFTAFANAVARVMETLAEMVSFLFGKTAAESAEAAKALYEEASGLKEVKDAAEEAEGSLASFDKINTIQTEPKKKKKGKEDDTIQPDFGRFGKGTVDLTEFEKLLHIIELIVAGIAALKLGKGFMDSLQKFLGLMIAIHFAEELVKDTMDAWNNGLNMGNLIKILGDILGLVIGLGIAFGKTGAGIGLIVGGLTLLATAFHDAMENGWNLYNAIGAIAGLFLTGLGIALVTGSWIPALIGGILAVLTALAIATGHGEELISGVQKVCEGFVTFITGIFQGDIEKALGGVDTAFEGLKEIVDAMIEGLRDTIVSFFVWYDDKLGSDTRIIQDFIFKTFNKFIDWINKKIDGLKEIFKGLITFLSGFFTNDWDKVWEGLKNIFVREIDFFPPKFRNMANTLITILKLFSIFLKGVFSTDWKKVWEDFKNTAVNVVNFLKENIFSASFWKQVGLTIITNLINGITGGFLTAAQWIKDLITGKTGNSTVTDNPAAPAVTRSAVSASASTYPASITRAQVPALARGAVIPANREFLAVLGDQKHGRNLEAPEGLIREIVGEGNQQIVVLLTELLAAVRAGKNVYLDGQKISDNTVRHINGSIARTGTIPLNI